VRAVLVAAVALGGCTKSHRVEPKDEAGDGRPPKPVMAAATDAPSAPAPVPDPTPAQEPVVTNGLCVTKGSLVKEQDVTVPTFRAVAPETGGDSASLEFVFHGETDKERALGSGQIRRQIGLKLRAQNGCNLVYAMWRLDPKPKLEVSVKLNPGATNHEQCSTGGYTKVKPEQTLALPELRAGDSHTLAAEIKGDELTTWIDGKLAWRGRLPESARTLSGRAGLRSDNLAYTINKFTGAPGAPVPADAKHQRCHNEDND
jgi:hypothetical protein